MAQKKQAYNPYLPLDQYIPDGEPHVFGDRVYIYGSHDKEGGQEFCMLDYQVFSAPVDDLSDWKDEGISYRADWDPSRSEKYKYMYAPDVVQGNDGRYYLYYAFAGGCFTGPIHVAVSETPAGPFSYLGEVRHPDGTVYNENITFDPAVINDNGTIRLYYGWSLVFPEETVKMLNDGMIPPQAAPLKLMLKTSGYENVDSMGSKEFMDALQAKLFDKSTEQVRNTPDGIMGANTIELEDDMLTVKGKAKRIAPGQFAAEGTGFEGHAFFEGSSIRKIGDTYYFIYSSQQQHELCYATSKYPDRDFVYGGVIVDNGDIGYEGRKEEDRLAMTANNHGSIECINGQWYIFYHRHTHKTTYSRQACAEKIYLEPNGRIRQVQMTSCGLNQGALLAKGNYPAVIACNITNGHMCHVDQVGEKERVPNVNHEKEERFIQDISENTLIGYKYFDFHGKTKIQLKVRGDAEGSFSLFADDALIGSMEVKPSAEWIVTEANIELEGSYAISVIYHGSGYVDLLEISFA